MTKDGKPKNLRDRLFDFSVRVIKFLATLPDRKEYGVFKYQLSKSGTAMGANYEESQAAVSRKEFENKIAICLKESKESNYWLRVIRKLEIGDRDECTQLVQESFEFKSIFASIIVKSKHHHRQRGR